MSSTPYATGRREWAGLHRPGHSLSAGDVERLTLEGVFVIVRDDEGRILARTVGSAADAGEPFWR